MGMNVLHRTVTKEDLASSFFTKLKQKHISAKEAAENMHLAQSTLSMWKEKKDIPDQQLVNAAKYLQDGDFSTQVSNYLFGWPTLIEDKNLNIDPLSLWVHLLIIEKEKSSISYDLEEILVHSNFNISDRSTIISAIKMLQNEAAIENRLSTLLIDNYNITDNELHPVASKFDKYHERVVKHAMEQISSITK